MAMRNNVNLSTGEQPSFVLFGRSLHLPLNLIFHKEWEEGNKNAHEYAVNLSNNMKSLDEKVRKMNLKMRDKYVEYANKSRFPTKIKPGDIVMIYTPMLKKGQSKKLAPKFRGPARVLKKVGRVCFDVQIIGGKKITRVHCDRLRIFDPSSQDHVMRTWTAELSDSEESVAQSSNEEDDTE